MVRFFVPPVPGMPGAGGLSIDVPSPQAPAGQPARIETGIAPAAANADEAYQRALTMAAIGMHRQAMDALRALLAEHPGHATGWRKLAALRRLAGGERAASATEAAADKVPNDPSLTPQLLDPRTDEQFTAAEHRLQNRFGQTPVPARMAGLRALLLENPRAVVAMRMLAGLEWQDGDQFTACSLLERALELAPHYTSCRGVLVLVLMAQHRYARALAETKTLIAAAPLDPTYRAMHADALRAVGDLPAAIEVMEALMQEGPQKPGFLCVYAQALHFAGRSADAAGIYRLALQAAPDTAVAYWGLAELRGPYLTEADIPQLGAFVARPDANPPDRMMAYYALGQALERARDYAASFEAYSKGATLAREIIPFDAAAATALVARHKAAFTAEMFDARRGLDPAPHTATPIFIVGMQRAGSTLLEQILASHSAVEPTLELPVMENITWDLAHSRLMVQPDAYPECVPELSAAQLAALGARYIEQAAAYRRTDKPYFIDKRPANWRDIGLINLILPQAKIIDIRRAPMAACFAMFKQILPEDAGYANDLTELGHYFNEYAGLMRHWDDILPGRVHHISYEALVENTDAEIRRLLDYCGLPFQDTCLRFWETDRAVPTPSAGQVRRPIFRDALDQWRHFQPWLGALLEALGELPQAT